MAPLTLALSLIFIFFGGHVFAGSHIWEPALAQRHNSTKSLLGKRYYYANPDLSVSNREPWPDRKIRYCFDLTDAETQSRKSALKKYLRDAHKLWISKGLDSTFKVEEVSDSVCKDDRSNVLLIFYSDVSMATFVGFPDSSIPIRAPKMILSDRTDIGLLDVVYNFAHELGHAWGLYHEHQNPNFWAGPLGSRFGEVWGPNNPGGWQCSNLKDYTRATIGLVVQTGGGNPRTVTADRLCSEYSLAWSNQFSAYDYLPIPRVGISHSNGHSGDDVDWYSMMLYPSGAGGRLDGGGTPTADNDFRAPILLKPDGSRIPINTAPSAMDVAALHAMYENVAGTKRSLINGLKNFKTVFKSSGSGPSGGSGCL
ncbi:hypothetical protein KJ359_012064 [Pestalotiopsis sp. 9143b]|nr:hypothetical protein KJ359_012064 [Pestalotiopsis sp. 9143b]